MRQGLSRRDAVCCSGLNNRGQRQQGSRPVLSGHTQNSGATLAEMVKVSVEILRNGNALYAEALARAGFTAREIEEHGARALLGARLQIVKEQDANAVREGV